MLRHQHKHGATLHPQLWQAWRSPHASLACCPWSLTYQQQSLLFWSDWFVPCFMLTASHWVAGGGGWNNTCRKNTANMNYIPESKGGLHNVSATEKGGGWVHNTGWVRTADCVKAKPSRRTKKMKSAGAEQKHLMWLHPDRGSQVRLKGDGWRRA